MDEYFSGYKHLLEDGGHLLVGVGRDDGEMRVTLEWGDGFAALTSAEAVRLASSLLRARGIVEDGVG